MKWERGGDERRPSAATRRAERCSHPLTVPSRARGFTPVGFDAIAEDAGYSKGSVYARFGSKADLFLAVLEQRCDQRLAPIGVDLGQHRTRRARIEAVARAHRKVIAENPAWAVAWVEFAAHATRDPDLSRRLRALNAGLRERAARRLTELGVVDEAQAEYLATVALVYGSGVSVANMAASHRSARGRRCLRFLSRQRPV